MFIQPTLTGITDTLSRRQYCPHTHQPRYTHAFTHWLSSPFWWNLCDTGIIVNYKIGAGRVSILGQGSHRKKIQELHNIKRNCTTISNVFPQTVVDFSNSQTVHEKPVIQMVNSPTQLFSALSFSPFSELFWLKSIPSNVIVQILKTAPWQFYTTSYSSCLIFALSIWRNASIFQIQKKHQIQGKLKQSMSSTNDLHFSMRMYWRSLPINQVSKNRVYIPVPSIITIQMPQTTSLLKATIPRWFRQHILSKSTLKIQKGMNICSKSS